MRRYRRKRYENKTAKRVFFRIFFVLVAAVVITVIATLMGHRVKQKLEEAERKIAAAETTPEDAEDNEGRGYYIAGVPESPERVAALAADPFRETSLAALLDGESPAFDTVAVQLTREGTLVYLSPARLSFIGLPAEELLTEGTSESYEAMKSFGAAVKTANFRMCAVMEATRTGQDGALLAEADKAILPELSGLGFDEVIFTGLSPLSDEGVAYLASLANDRISVGALFTYEDYMDERNEKRLRLLAAAGVLLCVDPQTEGEADITEATAWRCGELRNAESVYHLRYVLTSGEEAVLRAQYAALAEGDTARWMITTPIDPDAWNDGAEEGRAPEETEPAEETAVPVNPYATTRGDDAGTTENGGAASDDEVYRGSGSWH